MRHGVKKAKLQRTASHRKALLANQACSLITHGRITTTLAKAKALRPYVEKAHADDSAPAARTRRGTNPNSTKQRERNRIIRQWAKDRGMDVADRGALPKTIIDEYEATHS